MGWASQRRRTRAHRRPSYLSQASCVIVSGFTAALDLNIYPHRNLIRPRCAERAKPGRGKPVLSLFSRHISRTQSFRQNRHILLLALLALKLLVSLISRLVACSPRIVVDTRTHTYVHTYTQNDYCNPRCACAPRVNNGSPLAYKYMYIRVHVYTCTCFLFRASGLLTVPYAALP